MKYGNTIVDLLQDNYDNILDEYNNFVKNFDDNLISNTKKDHNYEDWKNEYHNVCALCEDEDLSTNVNNINYFKKHDYWYGYSENEKNDTSWETILIFYKGKSFIHPTFYGKNYFMKTHRLLRKFKNIKRVTIANLFPMSTIPLHIGDINLQKIHLGLKIPQGDVKFKVDGDILNWEDGKCFIFDDSNPHMAWNNSNSSRVVLIVDIEK